MKVKMIDPASGWRYGFPKPISEDVKDEDIREWLLKNGYPRREMESMGKAFYWRCWYQETAKAQEPNIVRAIKSTPDEILAILLISVPEMRKAILKEMSARRNKRIQETFSNM